MSLIVKLSFDLPQVADLMREISIAFWSAENANRAISAEITYWNVNIMKCDECYFPDDTDLYYWVNETRVRGLWRKLEEQTKEFAASIYSSSGRDEIRTDVFNVDVLYNIINGQTILPVLKRFVVDSRKVDYCYNHEFERFITWRNGVLKKSEERMLEHLLYSNSLNRNPAL